MRFSKRRRAREVVWGPEKPWVEPKKEIVAGPAADLPSSITSSSEDTGLGFFGAMASANSDNSNDQESEPKKSSPYGWEPGESSSSSLSSSPESGDNFEKIMRLQKKMDNLVERLEALEKKANN